MACASIEATVRSTFDDIRLVELSRSTCTVHLGIGQQTDNRSSVCVDEQRF